MSSADLYEDGFPHSTRAGYEKGCRGRACPGALDNGISCLEVEKRSAGDYGFQKKVAAGMTPTEIVTAEVAEKAATPARKAAPKPLVVKVDPFPAAEVVAAEPVPAAPEAPKTVADFPHGTSAGYQRGCRTDDCPGGGDSGLTCQEAKRAYAAEYQQRRTAAKKAAESSEAAPVSTQKPKAAPKGSVSVGGAVTVTDARTVFDLAKQAGPTGAAHTESAQPAVDPTKLWQQESLKLPAEAHSLQVDPAVLQTVRLAGRELLDAEAERTAPVVHQDPAAPQLRIDPTPAGGVLVDLSSVQGPISLQLEFAEHGLAKVWLDINGRAAA